MILEQSCLLNVTEGGGLLTVTVYFPQELTALRDEVALLHAEAVAAQVQRLACPVEQKREMLRTVGNGHWLPTWCQHKIKIE